jgi:hypothetical protein
LYSTFALPAVPAASLSCCVPALAAIAVVAGLLHTAEVGHDVFKRW